MKTLETLIKKALTEINPESSYIEEPSKELTRPFLTQRVEVEKYIDHTHLKNDTTESFLRTFIEEGKRLHPASICIHPKWVRLCHQLLSKEDSSNSKVKTCTVIGFPLGTSPTEVKVLETKIAVNDGADEIDMVLSLSDLKDRKLATIHDEISQIRSACPNQILKVIIETCLLTKEEILIATLICCIANADYIKTSTGFSTSGAALVDIQLMKKTIEFFDNEKKENLFLRTHPLSLKIKASGGIRDYETSLKFIQNGADRIGTSSTETILKESQKLLMMEKVK